MLSDYEHTQFAWLVTRVRYGDLECTVGDTDLKAAHAMGASLRRRLFRAQPFQTRVLAVLRRARLIEPQARAIPNAEFIPRPTPRPPPVSAPPRQRARALR